MRTKTVTRRVNWTDVKVGEVLCAQERSASGHAEDPGVPIATIRVVDVRFEPLRRIIDDLEYGLDECRKEGFGEDPVLYHPSAYIEYFRQAYSGCTPDTVITRIEFEYVD